MTRIIGFVSLVLFLGLTPLGAQNQEGSVAIAKSVEVTEALPAGGVECFEKVSTKMSADKAAEFCLKLAKLEADRSKKVANEAADATKASRPQIVAPYGGWGEGGWYSGGYRYRIASRPRYIRPPRPPRPPRQSRRWR